MTHFPHHSRQRRLSPPQGAAPVSPLTRDVLWGRPLFKAPALPNPRVAFDPLPFTVQRVPARPRG